MFIVFNPISLMKQRMIIDIDYDYECNLLSHLHLIVNTFIHSHLLKQHSLYCRKDYGIGECCLSSIEEHLQFNSFQSNTLQYHVVYVTEVIVDSSGTSYQG